MCGVCGGARGLPGEKAEAQYAVPECGVWSTGKCGESAKVVRFHRAQESWVTAKGVKESGKLCVMFHFAWSLKHRFMWWEQCLLRRYDGLLTLRVIITAMVTGSRYLVWKSR